MKKSMVVIMVLSSLMFTCGPLVAEQQEAYAAYCQKCGAGISSEEFLQVYRERIGDGLLCPTCLKRMRERKDGQAGTPSPRPSPSALIGFTSGSDEDSLSVFGSPLPSTPAPSPVSPFRPISPTPPAAPKPRPSSAPTTFDHTSLEQLAELAKWAVEERRKMKWPLEQHCTESFGVPRNSTEEASTKLHILKSLCEASKQLWDEHKNYQCTVHEVEKKAEVVDPQGVRHVLPLGNPLLVFRNGGVLLYPTLDGNIQIRDLANNCCHTFPPVLGSNELSWSAAINGFEQVHPLTSAQEAVRGFQERIGTHPSPDSAN